MPGASRIKTGKINDTRLNLVLDLDNTLISSLSFREVKKVKHRKLIYNDMEDYYRVYSRPYLQEFLDYAFANFHVSVWTAASRDYASFIVDKIVLNGKKDRKLRIFFYDDNCAESQRIYSPHSPKDLSYAYHFEGFYPCNTIIMDDLEDVKRANKKQTIQVKYFDAKSDSSEIDTFLKDVIPYLEEINRKYRGADCGAHKH